jgi:signal transduction histidine kinase/phage shock protein PspC (stress-responsive transcriptional regulator)
MVSVSLSSPASPPPAGPPASPPATRPPLRRSTLDAMVGGVCSGIAAHLGVPPLVVRAAVVLLTLFGGGLGAILYVVVWAVLPAEPVVSVALQAPPEPGRERRLTVHHWLVVTGLGLFVAGISLGTEAGSWLTDPRYAVPVLAIAAGALVAWYQLDAPPGRRSGRRRSVWLSVTQVVVGVVLAAFGVVVLVTQGQGPRGVWNGVLAALAVLVGAGGIAAPFAVRMYRGFQREQAERVRETARADIAAHLHDSVLQTLALIQRRADDPVTVARLARKQERELRDWLYAGQPRSADSLATELSTVVHEVEDEHGVPVEIVVTGDRPVEATGAALVQATREAVLNAVRHGRPPVSVYVELGRDGDEVFVRDHGAGFDLGDLAGVAEDRMGVRESILGRLQRAGGSARIRRLDDGTEVALRLPPIETGAPERPEGEPPTQVPVGANPTTRHTDPAKETTP